MNTVIFLKKEKKYLWEIALYVGIAIGFGLILIGHFVFGFINDSMFKSILAGILAQSVDGALGMAYGVTAGTFLLANGFSPSSVSASIHTAEIFTSGISGFMHLKFRNVNKKLLKTLMVPGMVGAILGAITLSYLETIIVHFITPLVSCYTLVLGLIIFTKAFSQPSIKKKTKNVGFLASFGGFMDGIGGGGWGPIVSSTLIAKGRNPLYTIGSVNLAEFFVSIASSFTFIVFIGLTHWETIIGLIVGGAMAAPLAVKVFKKLPLKAMMIVVSVLVISLSIRQIIKLF